MKKVIIILLVVCSFHTLDAQQDSWDENFNNSSFIRNTTIESKDFIGSPFLLDNCVKGEIRFADGTVKSNVCINLDLYQKEVVLKLSESEENYGLSLRLDDVKEIQVETKPLKGATSKRRFITVSEAEFIESPSEKLFVYEVFGPTDRLIAFANCELLEPEVGGYSTRDRAEFKKGTDYYLMNEDSKYEFFNFSKRRLKKLLGESKYTRVVDLLESQNKSLKTPQDLAWAISNIEN